MKKFFVFLFTFVFIGTAFAAGENIPTSKSYVDAEIVTKQDKIAANNGAAQVITNTGTAGEIGTKNIYDASGSYAGQSDALIDAQTMNAAVQNAIDSEFECVDNDCTLFNVSANERSGVFSGEKFTTDNQQVIPNSTCAHSRHLSIDTQRDNSKCNRLLQHFATRLHDARQESEVKRWHPRSL